LELQRGEGVYRSDERFVLNGSEGMDGCFTAAFFQTQHAAFSGRFGGRTAVGGGNGTQKNINVCAHKRQTTARPPVVCRSKHTS